jgi:hypothetical protein
MMHTMSRWRRSFDTGYLVVLVICLLAIWPFISRPGLPTATDAELHVFRLAELSRLVRGGVIYPRWAPNFYYGYGYPIFNYYAPLAYYIALPFELLPGLGPVAAVKIIFILGLLAAGTGMYGFVRDIWGRPAGLVAAAAFVYAPYIQFVDPHARGDLAELLSFGLFAWSLWALNRLRLRSSAGYWLASIALTTALILSHNLMALVFFGLLLAWAVWQLAFGETPTGVGDNIRRERLVISGRLTLALVLAAALAAFFWLTVALEQNAVNLSNLIGGGSHFDFRNHFLGLGDLLSPPVPLDWGATAPRFILSLGVLQWAMAGLGLVLLLADRVSHRGQAAFFALSLAFLVFLMLPVSEPIWTAIPILPYLQFPWRLLGPAAAVSSIVAGYGMTGLVASLPRRLARVGPAVAVALILLLALPAAQVPPWPADFGPTTELRVLEEELAGRWLGTTSTADFVPATVDVLPRPAPSLVEDFRTGRPLDRVNRASLPSGTTVESTNLSPLHFRYFSRSERDYLLRLFLFDFPGWRVQVDGRPVETELGRPEGFLVVPVPAGDHIIDVHFDGTTARLVSWLVTLGAAAATITIAWWLRRSQRPGESFDVVRERNLGANRAALGPVLMLSLAIFMANVLFIEPLGLVHYESKGLTAIPANRDDLVNFGQQIALIGYDAPNMPVAAGQDFEVTVYWKALEQLEINYQVFVHMIDDSGQPVTQSDKLNPGDFPSKWWPTDKYVLDTHRLQIPEDLDPGRYRLSLGLWVASEGWRLPVLGPDGEMLDDHYVLPTEIVVR